MRTASTASAKAQSRKGQSHRKPTCIAFCHHNPLLDSLIESPWLLPAPARTALQKAHMRTRQHSLTESLIQKGTNHKNPTCIVACLIATPASTASQKAYYFLPKAHIRTRQHSLTESSTLKGTDSQKTRMQCCFRSCLGPVDINNPRRLCRSPARMPRRL